MKGFEKYECDKYLISQNSWQKYNRNIVTETAIAFSFNGTTHATMMASPIDLYDFMLGFSFSEGIITTSQDIEKFEFIEHELGIEIQIRLKENSKNNFIRQRNMRLGPVSCGLCGIESLEAIFPKTLPLKSKLEFAPKIIINAMQNLKNLQNINNQTHAIHGAAFMNNEGEIVQVREDIGRHNALDKLIGFLIENGINAQNGAILLTSRVSLDLIQKCAKINCANLAAISAPSSLAIKLAKEFNINLYAIVRDDGLEKFA